MVSARSAVDFLKAMNSGRHAELTNNYPMAESSELGKLYDTKTMEKLISTIQD